MMAGNPSWWSMHSNLRSSSTSDHHQHEQVSPNLFISQTHLSNTLSSPVHQYLQGSSSSSSSSSSSLLSLLPFCSLADHHAQDFPTHSWSQLLLGGVASEQEERFSQSQFQSTRVMSNEIDVKQELSSQNSNSNNNNLYANHYDEDQQHEESAGFSNNRTASWTQIMPVSSPKSCVTTLSSTNNTTNNNNNGILDFSTSKRSREDESHQHTDPSNFECNSTSTGGAPKKPRVQSSSNPPLKVRKEKLGDRITSLHQLVSPFGKTDTASVLLEAIGYIRFLQGQIEALSSPYIGNIASVNNQQSVHGERNCLFPEHPGQLLNDSCLKRRGATNQEENKEAAKDLKSRGLCLVPISCTQLVGSDNGADYWAQSLGGGY